MKGKANFPTIRWVYVWNEDLVYFIKEFLKNLLVIHVEVHKEYYEYNFAMAISN